MPKEWVSVFKHKGHDILFLNGAGVGDSKDYKVSPPVEAKTYPTIGDAINAIETKKDPTSA